MFGEKISINIDVDKKIKEKAELLLMEIGIDLETAFNIFLEKTVEDGSLPIERAYIEERLRQRDALVENMLCEELRKGSLSHEEGSISSEDVLLLLV